MKKLTALVLMDETEAYTPEWQLEGIVEELQNNNIEIHVKKHSWHMMDLLKEKADLLIADYGGVGIMNSASANSQLWAVCSWAENHPSSLVILWSPLTRRYYEQELKEQFPNLENIVIRYPVSGENEPDKEYIEKIKLWMKL
jgi:hypothetical protein